MHPTLHPAPFTAAGWVFENKFDGFRALARKSGDKAELISRRGRLLARAFPEVIQAIAMLPHDAVLDAELVVSDERGHPAWDRLRRRSVMSRALRIDDVARLQPALLCVFDLLSIDGEDLRPLPLLERKRHQADLLPDCTWSAPRGTRLLAPQDKLVALRDSDRTPPAWRGFSFRRPMNATK